MVKALVLGASGATGTRVVSELLGRNANVIAIVRAGSSLNKSLGGQPRYREVVASIAGMTSQELAELLADCNVVISCLGHNLTFKGIFGKPRRLVTDAINQVVQAIELLKPESKIKIILMNTTGNRNRDIPETPPLSQRAVIGILRVLLPPHADNEQAADVLRIRVGQNHPYIEWTAVRPDGLVNASGVTEFSIHPSPLRNVIFDAGSTSRENVANFMANLATDTELWAEWRGRMPVIYNV